MEFEIKEENSFKALETNIEAFETVIGSMDAKISLLSSCDRLIPFYQKIISWMPPLHKAEKQNWANE